MSLLSSVKPFLPLLFTFVLPRAISYYRTVKTAIRTRPPRRPLPSETTRGLNVLFFSILLFFSFTFPSSLRDNEKNIFVETTSRLHIPTDVLFTRLSMLRPGGILTPTEEILKTRITTPVSRQLYLRFGPSTLADCSFCQSEDDFSYLLYYLPTNVLMPHLLHLFVLGLATSEPVSGIEASRWRSKVTLGALALAILDIYFTITFTLNVDGNMPSPTGLYWTARLLRPLILCFFNMVAAFLIYASVTNRFILFVSPANLDPEVVRRQREQLLAQMNVSLQMAQTKLRALSVARNAVVRDEVLKATDEEYWREVVAMEGPLGEDGIWDDDEVQASIARALGSGVVDVARMGKEADSFVASITRGLEERS